MNLKYYHHLKLRDQIFPFLRWFKGYKKSDLQNDLIAGLTVAVVLIPQSIAYSMIAGLPAIYGLYAAAVTPFIAAMWGSLRQLSTGPIAIMSLLVLTTLMPFAEPGSPKFIEMAFLLSFLVGLLYLITGIFRMGIIMSFISHSAVKGFTSAAAVIIISTQLPHFMGIKVSQHEYIFHIIADLIKKIPYLHLPTLGIGFLALGIIYGLKAYRKDFPAGLAAMIFTSALVMMLQLDQDGIAVVGKTEGGLPSLKIPIFDFDTISDLLGPAIIIALVSFAETYSVGKSISAQTKQKLNVNQEFIGQGMANLIGSFFQCYPVGGSFSRTAINFSSNAKTGISSVITSLSVVLTLLFLTPLLTYIPKAALAALVINAVLMLFHPREVFILWKMNRHDGVVAVSVFLLSLILKPDYALVIGMVMSLIFFLWKTMHPRIIRMTKDPEFNMFINADRFHKPVCPQILQLRSDNTIYFANADYTIEHILERVYIEIKSVKFLLLDFQAMGFIDITGVDELRILKEEIQEEGIQLALMYVNQPVKKVFESSGFLKEFGDEYLFSNTGEAISSLVKKIDRNYCRNVCPLRLFHECSVIKDGKKKTADSECK